MPGTWARQVDTSPCLRTTVPRRIPDIPSQWHPHPHHRCLPCYFALLPTWGSCGYTRKDGHARGRALFPTIRVGLGPSLLLFANQPPLPDQGGRQMAGFGDAADQPPGPACKSALLRTSCRLSDAGRNMQSAREYMGCTIKQLSGKCASFSSSPRVDLRLKILRWADSSVTRLVCLRLAAEK